MDQMDGVPCEVLGYHIKTRTQICLTCCISVVLELIVYLVLTVADLAVAVQHFRDGNPEFGGLTAGFVCLPAIVCFFSVITSPGQWPQGDGGDEAVEDTTDGVGESPEVTENDDRITCGKVQCRFFMWQVFNLVAFPVAAVYRLSRRIFWSIEAMFHERDSPERCHAVAKAAATSPFELYHFLQAFLQAAPQTMLQFYVLLREDTFRNYETTHVQVISIVASLVTMAFITGSYQRFESQKVVGRNYPWSSRRQTNWRRMYFERTKQPLLAPNRPSGGYVQYPAIDRIVEQFIANTPSGSGGEGKQASNDLDNTRRQRAEEHRRVDNIDLLEESEEPINDLGSSRRDPFAKSMHLGKYNLDTPQRQYSVESNVDTVDMDFVPRELPPPPPTGMEYVFDRMSTFKEMMFMKTELYIRDNVPRLPENFHLPFNEIKVETRFAPQTPDGQQHQTDEPDLVMPTRRKMITGLEQDDFIGKSVSFIAWNCFLIQRMIALSAFCYFQPLPCLILAASHYFLMLVCLVWETRFHEKIERITFYLFLAYVYVFCLLEFKIKFRKPRRWFVGYVLLVMAQNVSITVWWFGRREYSELALVSSAWWYGFMFAVVILSGIHALMCWVVYYYLLRPKDKVLFDEEVK